MSKVERCGHSVYGMYRGHHIHLETETNGCWYIRVRAPDGCYVYDGYWRDSAGKTERQALTEALTGACIIKSPTAPRSAHADTRP